MTVPAPESKKLQFEIPCSSEFISAARKAIESVCTRLSLSKSEVGDIALAVGEACANAVKFSSLDKTPIRVTCAVYPEKLVITVRNRGAAFVKGERYLMMPPTEQLDKGGMGLYLISRVMDELKVSSRNGTTTLRMVKKLRE